MPATIVSSAMMPSAARTAVEALVFSSSSEQASMQVS
eukprot:CAMPEP_0175028506 /NCGR_PEP_ID=MMETSP0005-20121125/19040_1 /TAXON_ID=420556 /ORGANISM="Ochromonas sp., Strain CCMP1393" /LENGTH=36 /DNA_ID= /DNA_START= /DNA_END= /DNA_ORIENTATION=